jgi:GWxTD domain-containing protein
VRSLTLCLLCILFSALSASAKDESFRFEAVAFQTKTFSPDSARVDLYAAVPYSLLTFLNAVERYVADYSLTLSIIDVTADSIVRDRKQDMSVAISKSEWEKLEELNITRADASQFSFTLAQGREYTVSITVRDWSTKRQLVQTKTFTVRRFPRDSASSSDLVVYRSRTGKRILPLIGEEASELRPSEAGMFFELYDAPQSTPYYHLVRLAFAETEREEVSRSVSVVVATGEQRMPVFSSLSGLDLWKGSYMLESYLLTDSRDTLLADPKELREKAMSFSTRPLQITSERGIPLVTTNIDDAIEQLFYIATGSAYDSLRRAETTVEKRRAIMAFWEGRKPRPNDDYNPPMEIFYRRVKYANDNFKGTQSGWRSDQGKIYIMLGAPTSSQRYAYEVNQRPYEVWEYYDLNQRYYFVDQFLVGDYRLATPPPPPGTFMWERSSH